MAGVGLNARDVSEEVKNAGGEIDARLTLTFSTASNLLDIVPVLPDRRGAMLSSGNGYETERGHALASLFSRAARQAHVIVFAVNAAGIPGSVPMNDNRIDAEVWKQVVASRRQSLRAVAEPGEGFALLDETDFAGAMSRIRAEVAALR